MLRKCYLIKVQMLTKINVNMKLCQVDSCEQRVFGKGYCKNHQSLREDKKAKAEDKEIDLPTLLELTQKVFNTFIRTRDAKKGCISCSKGKVEHAGHYYAQGACSFLRFDEVNVNGQCYNCNVVMYGNQDGYLQGLLSRYGKPAVFTLGKASILNRSYKWTRQELKDTIAFYKQKTQDLLKQETV